MKKIILISLGVVVLLVVVGVAVVFSRIDSIVRTTVEREGTAQLDLATTLQDADLSLFGGSLTLDKLAIANPEGYSAPVIFELGQVNVDVSYGELMDEPVRIGNISINSPRLVIERGAGGLDQLARINLRDLMDRLDTSSDEPTTKLIIDELTVSGTEVVIRPNIQGLQEQYVVRVPDITLTEVGTADEAQNGSEIGRVISEVAMALAQRAVESEDLPPELRGLLAGDLDAIVNQYKEKLSQELQSKIQEQVGDLKEKLGEDLGGAAEQLLQGDANKAVEDVKQRTGDAVNREIERGIGGLLGGRRSGDPTTQPATRPTTRPGG